MSSSSSLTQLLPPQPQSLLASSRLLTPKTLPIPLLSSSSSSLARNYSYAHTLLIPAYYYLRASALVQDPFPTLLADLGAVAVLECLFCAVCLPGAGRWLSGTSGGAIIDGTAAKSPRNAKGAGVGSASLRKKLGTNVGGGGSVVGKSTSKGVGGSDGAGGSWKARITPTLFSLILAVTLPPLPLTLIALVLGAPLYPTSLLPSTLLLSLHVSILGFLPLFYTHGVSSAAWRDVAAAWLPFDEAGVWAGTVGCVLGGWVGAIPMALDWDREWQKWPCTVLWGAVLGWAVGRLLTNGAKLGVGTRINLSEKEELPEPELEQALVKTTHEKKSD